MGKAENGAETPGRLRARTLASVGRALFDAGRYDKALAAFEEAEREDPDFLEARVSQANTLLMLQRYDDALGVCDDVMRRDPQYNRTYTAKANVLHRRGEPAAALEYYRKGLALAPRDSAANYNFACYWALEGNEEQCEEHLRRALEADPTHNSKAATDPDFDSVRDREWFQRLIAFKK
jgi:tetratricopeptide (TPR) repeat protein